MVASFARPGVALAALSLLVFAAGCDKEVKVTFTNTTAEPRLVQMSSPATGHDTVGTVAPYGGKLGTKVKIDTDDLPANFNWQAGDQGGAFTITKSTPDKIWVDIRPGGPGGVRDSKTQVHHTREVEVKDVPVYQDTVVD